MSTYTQILYQIVYSTWYREPTLTKPNRSRLFAYIAGILRKQNCFVYEVNGIEDHVHIVTHIHPSVALADLVKSIKLASTDLIKNNNLFPKFRGWQDGYAAFTYSNDQKDRLIQYVKNQEEHHRKKTFKEELVELLKEHGVPYDEKYLL